MSTDKISDVHKPFDDDGVTYCGWDGHDGCGEVWPCSTIRAIEARATCEHCGNMQARLAAAEAEVDRLAYLLQRSAVKREGICGEETPPLLLGGPQPVPSTVCELTFGHGSAWHEAANPDGSTCRWRAAQTPGDTDGR